MLLAILSDIHANLEALRAVLADARARGAARFLSLGDHIGFNGDPSACLDELMPLLHAAVQGNHEAAITHHGLFGVALYTRMITKSAAMLSNAQKQWLAALPLTTVHEGLRLMHAPRRGVRWGRVSNCEQAAGVFSLYPEKRLLNGHTHRPAVFSKNAEGIIEEVSPTSPGADGDTLTLALDPQRRYLINPGSVGQPRDGDPRAAYLLFDTEADAVTFCRVPYDVEAAAAKIAAVGLPRSFAEALKRGESPTGD